MSTKTNQFNIFNWLKEITTKKSDWNSFTDEQKEQFIPYMVNRFLSMSP